MQSCDNGETYAEQREKERDAISAFLNRDVVIRLSDGEELIHVGKINTISEGNFMPKTVRPISKETNT